jgi:hypothetical protein
VEMHGAHLDRVEAGKGATFQMELPTRPELHKRAP